MLLLSSVVMLCPCLILFAIAAAAHASAAIGATAVAAGTAAAASTAVRALALAAAQLVAASRVDHVHWRPSQERTALSATHVRRGVDLRLGVLDLQAQALLEIHLESLHHNTVLGFHQRCIFQALLYFP